MAETIANKAIAEYERNKEEFNVFADYITHHFCRERIFFESSTGEQIAKSFQYGDDGPAVFVDLSFIEYTENKWIDGGTLDLDEWCLEIAQMAGIPAKKASWNGKKIIVEF